jgi:hypothetical protein
MDKSHSFTYNNIGILTSLLEESIFIRLINNRNFQCYENNIDISDFNSPFDMEMTYDIICKCFNKIPNYDLFLLFKNNYVNIIFSILFDDKYNIKFNINIIEKILSNDANLSLHINNIEIKNNENIKKLEDKNKRLEDTLEELSNKLEILQDAFLNLAIPWCHERDKKFRLICLNSQTISYPYNHPEYHPNIDKTIASMINLESITLDEIYTNPYISFFNKNLKKLILKNNSTITSLSGIQNLPLLENIEIHSCQNLTNVNDCIIPYLDKNIKKIYFYSCGNTTKELLLPYCIENNIELLYT